MMKKGYSMGLRRHHQREEETRSEGAESQGAPPTITQRKFR